MGPLIALGLMSACVTRDVSKVDMTGTGQSLKDINVSVDLDIVFVIDNSASTNDKQVVFAQNFPKFIQALDMFPGGRPNVHIAVVSSTVDIGVDGFGGCPSPNPAENGLFQNTARVNGCHPPSDRYISDIQPAGGGARQVNYAGGDLAATFACIAQLGSTGCGFEAQLEGMKRSLDGTRPENAGFLRPGAYLVVIILTDEDDCSVQDKSIFGLPAAQVGGVNDFRCQPLFAYKCDEPISVTQGGTYHNCNVLTGSYLFDPLGYAQFLTQLKGDPNKVVVALIAGDPEKDIMTGPFLNQALALLPSCTATINGNPAAGRPSIRLSEFLAQFGRHGLFRTVCQSDYSQALTDIGNLIVTVVSPCLNGNIDTSVDVDPNNPGLQVNCTVSDVTALNTSSQVDEVLPVCPMTAPNVPDPSGPRPCWWVKPDAPACAATDSHLELHVERNGSAAAETTTQVQCATTI
jgi:hypothetical protein